MDELLTLEFDGGSRGNPGPAGIGVVIRAQDGTPLLTLGQYIGNATNNIAEYRALIAALEQAKKLGARRVVIRGDSELVVRQMTGAYRVRDEKLRPLYEQAQSLLRQFQEARIEHNLRHGNRLADKLANLAMDRRADVTDADIGESGREVDAIDQPSPVATKIGQRFGCPRCGCQIQVQRPSGIRPHQLRPFVCQCGMKMQPM
ncbi:ribonuclease HI family protein [Fontivita pretiosa]|uniref:ribonuclease HI family protein n=1 Tax=Fontivita pretiosa TaxID=2989684 RepID=UPI003D184480